MKRLVKYQLSKWQRFIHWKELQEISFTSDIKGVGRYPSGKNLASGTITKYPHGIIDGSWQGTLTSELGEQFMWWSHEKGKVLEGGKIKGLNVTTGFTNSQKLSWMNNLIMIIELSGSIFSDEFSAIGYEWVVGPIIKKS